VYLSRLLVTDSCQLLKHEIIVTLDPNIWKKSWKDRVQLPVFQLSQSESFRNYCATEIVFAYNNHFNWVEITLPCTETSQYLKQIMMPKTLTCCFFSEKRNKTSLGGKNNYHLTDSFLVLCHDFFVGVHPTGATIRILKGDFQREKKTSIDTKLFVF